jgi:hypothetical protein
MRGKTADAVIVMIGLLFSFSCGDSKMRPTDKSVKRSELLPEDSLRTLSQQTIYFGHQSVGYNILEGIRDLLKEYQQQALNIVETRELASSKAPFFAHSTIGRNGHPVSKLDDFSNLLRRRGQTTIDVALMKFCYVDFTGETDVQEVFRKYTETFAVLKEASPNTTFIHMTVPLTVTASGLRIFAKNAIKRLIGRIGAGYKDNIRINEFNNLMRETYFGKEPLFDLASIESTHADGTRVMTRDAGGSVYSLAPEYTFDGGHLNEAGRRIVALALLRFLAALPEKAPLK